MNFINCTVKKDDIMEQKQWVIMDIKDYIVPLSAGASYCKVREIYLEASGTRAMFTDHYNSNGVPEEKAAFFCARVGDKVRVHREVNNAYVFDVINPNNLSTVCSDIQ